MTTPLPADHAERMARVHLALDGLSVGDAFGQRFFAADPQAVVARTLPHPPWRYTDDTEMALSVAAVLSEHGAIEQGALAQAFAARYHVDPHRIYGAGMHDMLPQLLAGRPWREAAQELFGGAGSLGNGSAMRVAPVGAYFADALEQVARQAAASAEVTHQHPEGIAGAIAVAVATAWTWQWQAAGRQEPGTHLLEVVHDLIPRGTVRQGVHRARQIPLDEWEFTAAECLGNGSQITCPDTVPFCLWVAAGHLHDYREALWTTVRVGGDIDTNAAIVGGIVAMAVGRDQFPEDWQRMREGLVWMT